MRRRKDIRSWCRCETTYVSLNPKPLENHFQSQIVSASVRSHNNKAKKIKILQHLKVVGKSVRTVHLFWEEKKQKEEVEEEEEDRPR